MMVQSPLELYTTFLGFKYYDTIWQVCTKTGIAYLPFLMLMMTGMTKPFETPLGNGADISYRRTFIEFMLMVLVCYFGVSPAYHLDVKTIQYQSVCEAGAKTAVPGNSGTTYDDMFKGIDVDTVKVPLLIGLVLDVASGVTFSVSKSIPCKQDINQLIHAVTLAHFSTPLQNETRDFNRQCYLFAKSMFNQRKPDVDSYQTILNKYGKEDINWLGSHVLRKLYYPTLRARNPVPPFPYDAYPSPIVDHNVKAGLQQSPTYGYPICEQWWADGDYGLKKRIVDEVNKTKKHNVFNSPTDYTDDIILWLLQIRGSGSREDANDVLARNAIYSPINMNDAHVDLGSRSFVSHIANLFVTYQQLKDNMRKEPRDRASAQDVLPIIQALMLFIVIMFAPLVFIAGNYQLKVLTGLMFLLFSLVFTSAIWHALTAMQDTINDSIGYLNFQNPEQKPMFNNLFVLLYYTAPLFFNSFVAGTGVLLGDKAQLIANNLSLPTKNNYDDLESDIKAAKNKMRKESATEVVGEAAEVAEATAAATAVVGLPAGV